MKSIQLFFLDASAELVAIFIVGTGEANGVPRPVVNSTICAPEVARAVEATKSLFGGGTNLDDVPTYEVAKAELGSITVIDLVAGSKLCSSKSEARKMIEGGGIYLNDEKMQDIRRVLMDSDLTDDYCILRKGKKNYMKVVVK